MKMVNIRVSANIPEALSKPISDKPSPEECSRIFDVLREWAGYKRKEAYVDESNKAANLWANVAFRVAYETLPIFRAWRIQLRKNKGGRPVKDTRGLFGSRNPHAGLMRAVHRQQAKATTAKGRVSVRQACKDLEAASKTLPARYQNLSSTRLMRLYYEGKKQDKQPKMDIGTLQRGLARALKLLQNVPARGPQLTE